MAVPLKTQILKPCKTPAGIRDDSFKKLATCQGRMKPQHFSVAFPIWLSGFDWAAEPYDAVSGVVPKP